MALDRAPEALPLEAALRELPLSPGWPLVAPALP
jgi:hypothetical protein